MTTANAVGAVSDRTVDWRSIDWRQATRNVRRLQARIVKATTVGRWGRVKALQRLLTHSQSGRVLVVRRVTENSGKRSPGVDGIVWNTPGKKAAAVNGLKRLGYHPQPLRRVYIPKSNGKMRPLGIPTMKDRAMQALYLLALDPIAETTADTNSYGFRQQRSCADAISQCFIVLGGHRNTQWILEGDIRACFDQISHEWLVRNIPMDKVILRKWLKSGYMEKRTVYETTDGTPQGGIHSRSLGRRSHWWYKKQPHSDVGGTPFAFYCPGQGAEQRHGCGRRRTEPANSKTPRITAALIDMGSRAGDGQTQNLHGSHECESLLL
jgi:RNA-directed DNA polymerase